MTEYEIKKLKQQAKKLSKITNECHMKCLHLIAVQNGYKSWDDLIKENTNGNSTKHN